jgi:hypothetical protein
MTGVTCARTTEKKDTPASFFTTIITARRLFLHCILEDDGKSSAFISNQGEHVVNDGH